MIFGRKCKLIIGTGGTTGIDVSKLRWTFEVEKTMTEDPNTITVTIYNVDKYAASIEEGNPIILEAGYEGSRYGAIFTGKVRQPLLGSDNNVDNFVKIVGLDSVDFINYSSINTTVAKGATMGNVVDTCISGATNTIDKGTISNELTGTLSRGKVLFGQPKKYINQVSETTETTFYTNNEEINVVKPTDIPNTTAVELTPKTGLIGRPIQNQDGVTGTSLLHPQMDINTLVHIQSSFIDSIERTTNEDGKTTASLSGTGIYKIIKVKHYGDNYGNDWYTEFEAIAQPNSSVTSTVK